VQADQFAQLGEPDTLAVTRDLLEDREGAAKRLDAHPLPVVGVVVDIVLDGLHQLGDSGLAQTRRLVACLLFFARSHRDGSPGGGTELYQAARN
jgi:hypothetical protein